MKNHKTAIRYDDQFLSIVQEQPGETFSEKLRNLVYDAYIKLPEIRAETRRAKKQLTQLKERTSILQNNIMEKLEKHEHWITHHLKGLDELGKSLDDVYSQEMD